MRYSFDPYLPQNGRRIVFTEWAPSYCKINEPYIIAYSRDRRGYVGDVSIQSVENGSMTFVRATNFGPKSWPYKYVDEALTPQSSQGD